MNLLTKFNQTFGFTQTESKIVFFLVFAFVAGIGIKIYKSSVKAEPHYDYSELDSEFTAHTENIGKNDSTTVLDNDTSSRTQTLSIPIVKKKISIEGKLDINKALKSDFVKLPGIGEAMAERIIRYREANGVFFSVEDIKNVKGIGKKKFEQIVPFIMVEK